MGTWSRTLPDSLGFPVYGLCSDFAGSRTLGLWVDESGPVWRVPLDHEGGDGDDFITVLTIGKLSGRFSFNDAVSAALFDLVQLGMTDPPGDARGRYIVEKQAEMGRLESDLDSPE